MQVSPGDLPPDQRARDTQPLPVGGDLDSGHPTPDTQSVCAAASSNGNGRSSRVTQGPSAVAGTSNGQSQNADGTQAALALADPSDALLLILADALDDLERQRIASENRLRSLQQVKGLEGSRAEQKLSELTATLGELEHKATLELQRAVRNHALGPWVKRTVGIGEKQGARLLAAIGDPYWNDLEDRPRRGPAELWAYCGYDPKQKRRKGVRSNWNADAKMRAYLCAESCMKNRTSPYREVYDKARMDWATRDTTDGHKHNHALRLVAKAILKDLWREARAQVVAPPLVATPAPSAEVAARTSSWQTTYSTSSWSSA